MRERVRALVELAVRDALTSPYTSAIASGALIDLGLEQLVQHEVLRPVEDRRRQLGELLGGLGRRRAARSDRPARRPARAAPGRTRARAAARAPPRTAARRRTARTSPSRDAHVKVAERLAVAEADVARADGAPGRSTSYDVDAAPRAREARPRARRTTRRARARPRRSRRPRGRSRSRVAFAILPMNTANAASAIAASRPPATRPAMRCHARMANRGARAIAAGNSIAVRAPSTLRAPNVAIALDDSR